MVRSRLTFVVLLAFATVMTQAQLAKADTLDFSTPNICSANSDGSGAFVACSNFGYINENYGDTANATVTYKDLMSPGSTLRWWGFGPGYYLLPAAAVSGGNSDATSWDRVEIAPLGGQQVNSFSFTMDAWPFTGTQCIYCEPQRAFDLVIRDLGTNEILYDYSNAWSDRNAYRVGDPWFFQNNGIAIEWTYSGYNIGIDNINFTVSAPEPATVALLGTGLLALGIFRRRRA